MLKNYFTNEEVADILRVETGMVEDLMEDKGEWQTNDIILLLDGLAKKFIKNGSAMPLNATT
ncbi:MAG: hypothetical protein FWD90_12085 [Defluviitaleaceae bacterium]|nr:hypothetical protein [Defluviitaleaceae bacterium]